MMWQFIEGLFLELFMFFLGALGGCVITSIVYEAEIERETNDK